MQPGIVPLGDPLLKRVRPRAGSEGVARSLLGDVYLIDRLESAFDHFGTRSAPGHLRDAERGPGDTGRRRPRRRRFLGERDAHTRS